MGTYYVEQAGSSRSRLLPFVFSSTQAYVLELCPGTIRFFRDGGYLADKDINMPWSAEQYMSLSFCQAADVMIGGLAQAGSASQAADAQASAYKAQGSAALAQAQNKAAQERDKYRRLASQQRAAYGSSGVDVNSGSPLDVLAATDASVFNAIL